MERDHEILHRWAKHPKEASTRHTLVQNDMYGISHEIAYEQDLLTAAQIKDMHDEWVKKYDPVGHTTPINVPGTEEEKKRSRWDEVIVDNPEYGTLTKRDIYRYYSTPEIKNKIFEQVRGKPLVVRQAMDVTDSWLKRPAPILKNRGDANDPEDLQYYIERRNIEFHPAMSEITDKIVIDIDPGKDVDIEEAKKVAKYVSEFLENQPEIGDTSIQFSGNRGFYVWGDLSTKQNINILREKLKKILSQIKEMNGIKVTLSPSPGKNTVRLDLSPMKNLGSVKAEGSLDYRTGYISKKIIPSQLFSFNPKKDAVVNKNKLKPAYSFKDESLV